MEGIAGAERLLVPIAPVPTNDAAASRIANLRSLALVPRVHARLLEANEITLVDLPLGPDTIPRVTLGRFDPFSPGTRVDLVEAGGVRRLALPDRRYYRGRVDGDLRSLVVVVATPDSVHGVVAANGTIYRFGPDRAGTLRSWALRDADPATLPSPPPFCPGNASAGLRTSSASAGTAADLAVTAAGSGYSPPLLAEVAIDTDEEFLAHFRSTAGALAYLADLAAVVSAIYDADVGVRVTFRFIRLWATADPWVETNPGLMVYETGRYWAQHETGVPRDLVHFISGKDVAGGAAFLDGLCNAFGYGASTVYAAFDVLNPSDTWDVAVVAHEIGHNFGSVHTHCYEPPLDHCSGTESGCYRGVPEYPPDGGTIMSYCHQLVGGMANVNLTFGPVVSAVLRTRAANGVCIGPPCGDGHLDEGEECDDGNGQDGDCCSSLCTAGPDGASCDDGEPCTAAERCVGGVCAGLPVADGTPCDDGRRCTDDRCAAGSCVGTPGPAAACKAPVRPLASRLMLKVAPTPAGNRVVWKWRNGAATSVEEFGDPTRLDGYELCIYDAAGETAFSAQVPAGRTCGGRPCWARKADRGFAYKSDDTRPDGMQTLSLASGVDGAAKITARGKSLWLDMPALGSLTLPLRVEVHGAGGCWGATFSAPTVDRTDLLRATSD